MTDRDRMVDVVVVGSGAGAAALLLPLLRRGLSVTVLERGEDVTPPRRPDLLVPGTGFAPYVALPNTLVDELGLPRALFAAEGSALGGGTVVYTGNVLRFHPRDFRRRTELGDVAGAQLADWPLSYEELAPYYDALEREMGVAGDASANPFEPARSASFPLPAVPLDCAGELAARAATKLGWHPYPIPTIASAANGRAPCARCGLCTAFPCTFAARWSARQTFREAEKSGVRLELGATVLRVETDGGRATGVTWLDREGVTHETRGKIVVLAANAIQTPRILLESRLANGSGQVGRNLMTHVMDNFITLGHVPGVRTTDSGEAAGCTLAIQDFYEGAAPSGITLEPRTIGSEVAFRRMATQDPSWRALDDATLHARFVGNVAVLTMMEDLPRAENRVYLHPTLRDPRGFAVPVVEYTAHSLDLETAAIGAARARELLVAAGAQDVISVPAYSGRFHFMGTCRMGNDSRTSVVDRDGRAHELDNLYVADSSVFVTSAGANPSLTVQAVARRIGEQIGARL